MENSAKSKSTTIAQEHKVYNFILQVQYLLCIDLTLSTAILLLHINYSKMNNIFVFFKSENTTMHLFDSHDTISLYRVWVVVLSSNQDQRLFNVPYVIWPLRINVNVVENSTFSMHALHCLSGVDMASVMVASPFSRKVQRIKYYVLYQLYHQFCSYIHCSCDSHTV